MTSPQLLDAGRTDEAIDAFRQAVDVGPVMAFRVVHALRRMNVESVVAPYEADAQMAFLVAAGGAKVVVTEDADLILYGCPLILFRMDKWGNGTLYDRNVLMGAGRHGLPFNLNDRALLHVGILSGCDCKISLIAPIEAADAPSVRGVGLKTAITLMLRHKDGYKVMGG